MRRSLQITLTLGLLAAAGPVLAADPPATESKAAAPAVSPRDAASGMPTGKRQHSPIVITKPLDVATGDKQAKTTEPTSRRTGEDCDDANVATQPETAQAGQERNRCTAQNPLHQGKPAQGTHPLHADKKD